MARQQSSDELTQAQIQAELDELENKLERLRVRYEQFFLGIEKIPPTTLRTDVVRIMRRIEQYQIRNTALKFRFRSMVQKFHSYSTYWNRTLREIENGTYRRHIERLQTKRDRRAERLARVRQQAASTEPSEGDEQRAREQLDDIASAADEFLASMGLATTSTTARRAPVANGAPTPPAPRRSIQVDFDDLDEAFEAGFRARPDTGLKPAAVDLFGGGAPTGGGSQRPAAPQPPPSPSRPVAPPPRPAAARPAPPTAPPTRNATQRLYDEFVAARERLGLGEKTVSYERFAASIDRQAAEVRRTHQCRDVDFRVVVKDGKPFLKPLPKK